MKYAFSFSFYCYEIKRCLVFYCWPWYFDQTPTCKIKTNQSWKIKCYDCINDSKFVKIACQTIWGDQTILSLHMKLNHTSWS
jgi:hypothetical protein